VFYSQNFMHLNKGQVQTHHLNLYWVRDATVLEKKWIFLLFVTNVSPTTLSGQRNSYPFYGVLFNSGYQSNVGKKFPKMIHFAWVNVHMYTRTACCYTISATIFFLGNRRGVSPYWSYMLKMKRVLQVFTAKNNKVKLQDRL